MTQRETHYVVDDGTFDLPEVGEILACDETLQGYKVVGATEHNTTQGQPKMTQAQKAIESAKADALNALEQQIADVTADIRAYQQDAGPWVIFDPSTEAYRLCDIRSRLAAELRRVKGW